jgi:hypothetical protein
MVKNEEMPGSFKWRSNLNIKPMIFSREAEKVAQATARGRSVWETRLGEPN